MGPFTQHLAAPSDARPALGEAVAAVHGGVAPGLEGQLGLLAALPADGREVFARCASPVPTPAASAAPAAGAGARPALRAALALTLRIPPGRAPLGLVLVPQRPVPLLFARRV